MATRPGTPRHFPIVAIGASAGGLRAFEDLLNALPPEPGSAFVLVPHLAPQFKSHLAEILARSTKLPVSEVKGGDRILPNRIYVLPPNRSMLIKDGVLRLSSSGHKSDWRNPIDSFFRSLADDHRKLAVGVLLSGEGSDGTEGLRAIKERGGTTFAQNQATAAHLSMPHSAVVAGFVDFVLSPAEIGRKLGAALPRGPRKPKGEESLNSILELLRNVKGVEFELYKRSTLRRRIQRRMALKGTRDPEKYLRALSSNPEELEQLYRDVLISVTSFFREPDSFKALKSAIYPRLLKSRSADAPIRIWVPGCSTGEEAYSHAMNLVEFLGERVPEIPFQVFATDVNPAVIEKARLGSYPKKIKSEVSPERLRRFFVETSSGYRIAPAIRERCVFAVKNLVKDPPFTNLDLISCRNLLIYLGPTLQEKAFQIFQYALKPRGILMLGRSESIGDFSGRFTQLDLKRKVFSERKAASIARFDFIRSGRFLETESAFQGPEQGPQGQRRQATDSFDLQGELDSALPSRYVPNGVVVNGELEVLRFLGNTSPYLRPAPGKPSMNLRRLAAPELLLELRAAIHAAKKSASAVRKDSVSRRVRIEILPIKATALHKEYYLALFEDIAAAAPSRPRASERLKGGRSRRVLELKEDLAASGEHLKAIIEEQESTNARLAASNEELLSSNEELQSINEEFETAKEELQSTNEELITSTEEVERVNQVLKLANSDLSNILANIEFPIVLLDPDLTVRRFTPPAEKTLGLSAEMIGRSIADVKLPFHVPELKRMLLDVVKTARARQLEVQDTHGRWRCLYLRPYWTEKSRTERSRAEGAVMVLIDIHDRKLAEKATLRLATLVRDSNDAVIILDLKNRVTAWNHGAHRMFGYTEAHALGMSVLKLVPESDRAARGDWIGTLLAKGSVPSREIQRRAKDGRVLDVQVTATLLRDDKGRPAEIATTLRDITEQKGGIRELRRLHARVITAQETERRRLARELHDGVGQILSGLKFRLESLPDKIGLAGGDAQKILQVGSFLDRAISEIRRVSQNLMPSELEDLGLEPALAGLCREFKGRAGVHAMLRTGSVPTTVHPELALALFRIAQEALNNVAKHSGATSAVVALARSGKMVELSVSDNGIGFVPGGPRRGDGRGIGLGNMRERAESVGGSIELQSAPGGGTTLKVRAPMSPRGGYRV